MTQPAMYDIIDNKRSVRQSYLETLIGRGDITTQEAETAMQDYRGAVSYTHLTLPTKA